MEMDWKGEIRDKQRELIFSSVHMVNQTYDKEVERAETLRMLEYDRETRKRRQQETDFRILAAERTRQKLEQEKKQRKRSQHS